MPCRTRWAVGQSFGLSGDFDDPDLAAGLLAFHSAAETPGQSALHRDTQLRGLVSCLIRRYAVTRPAGRSGGGEPAAVRRVRAYLDAHAAEDISLADLGTLRYTPEHRPVTAANSAYRVAALHGAWVPPDRAVTAGVSGPVLLVDDLADTGWTLTMAARVLRGAGVEAVLPFALASTS